MERDSGFRGMRLTPGKSLGSNPTSISCNGHVHKRRKLGSWHGSAEHIPLGGASVDVVHARFAYFFPTPGNDCSAGLSEVMRVLRPGGTLVVIDNDQSNGDFADLLAASSAAETQGYEDLCMGLVVSPRSTHHCCHERLGVQHTRRPSCCRFHGVPGWHRTEMAERRAASSRVDLRILAPSRVPPCRPGRYALSAAPPVFPLPNVRYFADLGSRRTSQ